MKAIDIPDRWIESLRLRNTGITYREVGELLGVSSSRASVMCSGAQRRLEFNLKQIDRSVPNK